MVKGKEKINCVICYDKSLLKSSVVCNICHIAVCRKCIGRMKSSQQANLQICPVCRGKSSLCYFDGTVALPYDESDNFISPHLSSLEHRHLQMLLTVPKVIMLWTI